MSEKIYTFYKMKAKESGCLLPDNKHKNLFKKVIRFTFAVMLLSIITACGTTATTDTEEGSPPAAVRAAQSWLADQLNVSMEEIEIISSEQVEWTDSCFGLGGPAEMCAAETTPGWQAIFEVSGQQYEVRLNEAGTLARSPQIP